MTTIPLLAKQKSNLHAISRPAFAYVLVWFSLLWGVLGKASAETDAAEQLYRRGYPNDVALEWAVSDYNSAHRSDSVAQDYPELKIDEILPAISRAITETPKKEKGKLAKLAALRRLVMHGSLPRGSRLTFQYDGRKTRTPYTTEWGKLSDKFAIVLFSGMDGNPQEESEYNENAPIFGVVIRFHKRVDHAWEELMKSFAEKRKRMKEHLE